MDDLDSPLLGTAKNFPPMFAATPPKKPEEKQPKRKGNHRKAGGRFAAANDMADITLRTLRNSEFRVWFLLWRDTRDGSARTSHTYLADRAGLSVRSVNRAINGLKKRGLLKVVRQGGLGRGMSRYVVVGVSDQSVKGKPPKWQ